MTGDYLLLDPEIRDWVVIPMVMMVVMVGMGRHYAQELMRGSSVEPDIEDVKNKQILAKSVKLRANGAYICEKAYVKRKLFLTKKETGALRAKVKGATNPMSNPQGMVDMMKGNLIFMLPNIVMMGFVSYFFAGFVCVKVPFPLPSNRFKVMLQRGVDLKSLNVSYVSSLALYFIAQFGLSGVYQLVLGADVQSEDARMMQMQMGMANMAGGGPQGFDANAAFKMEREQLGITKRGQNLENAEMDLLGDRYPREVMEGLDLSRLDAMLKS